MAAAGFFLVLTTVSSRQKAAVLSRQLVRSRLAACVNILPRINSFYWWKGTIENGRESMLLLKTDRAHLKSLCKRLKELHSYEVPEILALPLAWGSPSYLQWIQSSLRGGKTP